MPSLTAQTALASLNTTKEAFPWLDRSVRLLRSLPTPQHLPLDLVQQAANLITNEKAAFPPPSLLKHIPVEIFRHIFVRYAEKDVPRWPDDIRPPGNKEITFFLGPLPLSHVCGLWRDICLASPELWSIIEVRSGLLFSRTITRGQVELTRLWLRRSANYPVSLFLRHFNYGGRHEQEPHSDNMDAVMALFAYAFPRSKRIELIIKPSFRTLHILRNIEASQLTMLSAGYVELIGKITPEQDFLSARLHRVFHSAPKMSEVDWNQSWPIPRAASWSQLVSITLATDIRYSEAYTTLRRCVLLESLVINRLVADQLTDTTPLILPYLRRLNILADAFVGAFFDALRAPRLSSLQLRVSSRMETSSMSFLPRFLQASRCSLEYFGFSGRAFENGDLLICSLPWLQDLKALSLIIPLTDTLCEQLTIKQPHVAHTNYLPFLEYLHVARLATKDGHFSNMIASRFHREPLDLDGNCTTRLYRFHAWAESLTVHRQDSAAISQMLREGLKGTLNYIDVC